MVGILNRVGMFISTTGTGSVTANTAISHKFLTPAEAGAVNGEQYFWLLEEGNDFELFIGTWTLAGTAVSRDTVLASKIGGVSGITKLTLAGNASLRSVAPAEALRSLAAGKQAVWIPASAMAARTSNGMASGTVETTTNKVMLKTLDADASTQEFAQFAITMPKSWNEGTVSFLAVWSHAATTTNFGVAWSLAGLAVSDDDALDTAFGTAVVVTDTGGTTNDLYRTAESAAVTISGSPAALDTVFFQVARVPADAADTMAVDARLHGIVLFITTDAGNDA